MIITSINKNSNVLRSFGVKRLLLIGSYARGEAKRDSDIDFVVEFKKGRGLFDDYACLLNFLEDLFKKDIDLGELRLLREELKPSILGGTYLEAEI